MDLLSSRRQLEHRGQSFSLPKFFHLHITRECQLLNGSFRFHSNAIGFEDNPLLLRKNEPSNLLKNTIVRIRTTVDLMKKYIIHQLLN